MKYEALLSSADTRMLVFFLLTTTFQKYQFTLTSAPDLAVEKNWRYSSDFNISSSSRFMFPVMSLLKIQISLRSYSLCCIAFVVCIAETAHQATSCILDLLLLECSVIYVIPPSSINYSFVYIRDESPISKWDKFLEKKKRNEQMLLIWLKSLS